MNCVVITDEGKIFCVNPADYQFMPNQEKLERGDYDLKFQQEVDGDKVKITITQEMMPLVKIR